MRRIRCFSAMFLVALMLSACGAAEDLPIDSVSGTEKVASVPDFKDGKAAYLVESYERTRNGETYRSNYKYDVMGNLITRTHYNEKGYETDRYEYSYFSNGLVSEVSSAYQNNKDESVQFSYDASGRIVTISKIKERNDAAEETSKTIYSYTHAGQISDYQYFNYFLQSYYHRSMEFNAQGQHIKTTYHDPDDEACSEYEYFEYDEAGRRMLRHEDNFASNDRWVFYQYDEKGQLTYTQCNISAPLLEQGVRKNWWYYVYDASGRLVRETGYEDTFTQGDKMISDTEYAYDSNGRLISVKAHVSGEEAAYAYDKKGQCVYASLLDGTAIRWNYDIYGNIVEKTTYDEDGDVSLQEKWTYQERIVPKEWISVEYRADYEEIGLEYLEFIVDCDWFGRSGLPEPPQPVQ